MVYSVCLSFLFFPSHFGMRKTWNQLWNGSKEMEICPNWSNVLNIKMHKECKEIKIDTLSNSSSRFLKSQTKLTQAAYL